MMWSLLVLIGCASIHVATGSKGKFKSCSDSGFCKRQKALDKSLYFIDPQSVEIKNEAFQSVMVYRPSPTLSTKKLSLSISRVVDNVIRLFVTELHPIRQRYQLHDILTEHARNFLKFSSVQQQSDHCILSWNDKYSVHIQYDPFKITVSKNGKIEMIVNEFEKFYFEPYIIRKEYGDCDGDDECPTEPQNEKDLWEERFSSHTYYYDNGPASIGLDFTFVDNDFVYGIPEHASVLPLKNTNAEDEDGDDAKDAYSEPYRLWNLDVFEYKLDVPDALYGAIPYILGYNSDSANAVLWMNSAETYIDVKNSFTNNGKNVRWMSESGVLESFIILYDNKDIKEGDADYLQQYYELTGYPQLPPIFALGHHQCRWNYNDIEDVKDISDRFDELNIPNDFIWLDIEHTDGKRYFTWDQYNFKNAQSDMIDYVAASGRKMVTIVDPHIKKDDNYYIYSEINNLGLWTKNRDNNDYDGWCWPGDSRYPDFTNPKMRQFWSEQFALNKYDQSTLDLFIWNDMNEPSVFNGPEVSMPISNIHHNEFRHNEIHNIYGYYVHEATFNGLLLRGNHKLRPFVLSRSFFAGTQKYGAIWTGDNTANWEHLEISVPMLLSLSIAGLPFVGADIGGFFNNPDGELMARWYELGAYYPFFRNHAHQDTERRELWQFDDFYAQRMKNAILARYRILPYLYTQFYLSSSSKSSNLIIRPLWYGEFRDDKTTYNRDDAFMFGPAFYIQPITQSGINEIDVNLPENLNKNAIYYEMYGNRLNIYNSGKHHLIGYQARIPVLRYGGTITVEKHRIRRSASLMRHDPVTIIIALDSDGNAKGDYYMDDEETFNYINNGEYIQTKLIYNGKENKLINQIISKPTNDKNNIPKIEIERILIMGRDIDKKGFREISINTRVTKQFGVATHTLAIRQPKILINDEFSVTLMM